MECDICHRGSNEISSLICASCARTSAYLLRLEQAQILLAKTALSEEVEKALLNEPDSIATTKDGRLTGHHQAWSNELQHLLSAETKRSIESTKREREQAQKDAKELQEQIDKLKADITVHKEALAKSKQLATSRRNEHVAKLANSSHKITESLNKIHSRSVDNRATLCREAASLMRLRQRRRQKDAPNREQYSIAGLTLQDLREISNIRCSDLNAVMSSVARLVLLLAFYLGVRLPAEITLPSPDHPIPTINVPSASYIGKNSEIPASGTVSSGSSSPSTSKHENSPSTKPRPLSIICDHRDERVFSYQPKESTAFSFFAEGIGLLAWNVAWLCRSQGFTAGTSSWEDVCNIGRNLHQLLFLSPQAMNMTTPDTNTYVGKRPSQSKKQSTLQENRKEQSWRLGQYSDLTAYASGGTRAQAEQLKNWELGSWQSVAVPLKAYLVAEIKNAEWEMLQDQEWDDGGEQFNEAVLVKGRTLDAHQYDDARSIMTVMTRAEDQASSPGRVPGTSGWTKLKSREKS